MPWPEQTNTINPVLPEDDSAKAIADMLRPGTASALTPDLHGDVRVPRPSNFRAVGLGPFGWGADYFVLSWDDIDSGLAPVKGYRIYVSNYINSSAQPLLVSAAFNSPGIVPLVFRGTQTLVFYLQPVLTSGEDLPLPNCPTCTAAMPGAAYVLTGVDAATGDPTSFGFAGGLPDGFGNLVTGFSHLDQVNGRRVVVALGSVGTVNGNLAPGARIVQASNAANAGGLVEAFDGSGAGGMSYGKGCRARLNGTTGQLALHDGTAELDVSATTVGTGVPTGTLQGYITIVVAGVTRYVPFYS